MLLLTTKVLPMGVASILAQGPVVAWFGVVKVSLGSRVCSPVSVLLSLRRSMARVVRPSIPLCIVLSPPFTVV